MRGPLQRHAAHLVPPDERSCNGNTDALHKVPKDMDDSAPQVDAVPIPSMLVAMAVAVPALCIPVAVIMAFMTIAIRISRFHILHQQSPFTRIPHG